MKKTPSAQSLSKKISSCRVCRGSDIEKVISLGATPPANAFLKKEEIDSSEAFFPLEVGVCHDCGFAQLLDIVSPDLLFGNYVYVSSTSPVFVRHFEELSDHVIGKFKFQENSLIVDIGSNDGILLRPFKSKNWRVVGVDPATKIAEMATANGIPTVNAFFTPEIAKEIVSKYGKAKIVTSTSAFPHINDLDGIVEGVKALLDDDGVFIVEAYYLVDLLEKNLFDTIYHEHLSYFTVETISRLLNRLGMEVFDVERIDTHGGSIRVFSQKAGGPRAINQSVLDDLIDYEKNLKVESPGTYKEFFARIEENKKELVDLLNKLKSDGKKIVGYGAPAKGNTLLNYFKIGPELLDYIVDDSSWKQGLYTPGMHIPVVPSTELIENTPDYILILAWNFADPIMKRWENLRSKGVRFIIPVPKAIIN